MEIIHDEREVTVSIAQRIGLGAPVINSQLQLERRRVTAHIDKSEAFEAKAFSDGEAESLFIEGDRPRLFQHADH
ncbi:hypothetical protein AcidC75_01540 [Acidisoma sp. C75]